MTRHTEDADQSTVATEAVELRTLNAADRHRRALPQAPHCAHDNQAYVEDEVRRQSTYTRQTSSLCMQYETIADAEMADPARYVSPYDVEHAAVATITCNQPCHDTRRTHGKPMLMYNRPSVTSEESSNYELPVLAAVYESLNAAGRERASSTGAAFAYTCLQQPISGAQRTQPARGENRWLRQCLRFFGITFDDS